jgi:hypothetical protein
VIEPACRRGVTFVGGFGPEGGGRRAPARAAALTSRCSTCRRAPAGRTGCTRRTRSRRTVPVVLVGALAPLLFLGEGIHGDALQELDGLDVRRIALADLDALGQFLQGSRVAHLLDVGLEDQAFLDVLVVLVDGVAHLTQQHAQMRLATSFFVPAGEGQHRGGEHHEHAARRDELQVRVPFRSPLAPWLRQHGGTPAARPPQRPSSHIRRRPRPRLAQRVE